MSIYVQFLDRNKSQLLSSGVPEHLWISIFYKVTNDIFDAGTAFSLLLIDYSDSERTPTSPVFTLCVSNPEGIKASDPECVYLIDHAWTFRINQARQHLESMPSLADRMSAMTGVDRDDPGRIDKILKEMWKFCQTYSVSAEGSPIEDRMPIWYIMDEVGSAVNHSDDPNFRIVPFLETQTGNTYSLLFPIIDCDNNDIVTRDYLDNFGQQTRIRVVSLLPWVSSDVSIYDFSQQEPEEDYFTSGHIVESLPKELDFEPESQINRDGPIKVYSQYDVLTANLNEAYFEIVEDPSDADILWLTSHFKEFEKFSVISPNKFVNQFPFEYVITVKDLLSIVCRRNTQIHHDENTLETFPEWLPTTYNLKTELVEFVSYFQNRTSKNLDNHWIVKPFNLARGLDTHITDNLNQIIRLPATGPKIAQKYIERPVLFFREELNSRVKFDIRYMILLKSVHPLEAYIHRKFFLRFANKKFELNSLDDYEKHFTVMNYQSEAELRHIRCEEFVEMWKEQYCSHDWEFIEAEICKILKEVLLCATKHQPPTGIAASPQSRAVYAADLMLAWSGSEKMQPKLLEINFTPDCKRACDYYPDFFNDIFKLLFLSERNDDCFRLITDTDLSN